MDMILYAYFIMIDCQVKCNTIRGQIFELDPLLKDTEMSKYYFNLAEENGVVENHCAYIR